MNTLVIVHAVSLTTPNETAIVSRYDSSNDRWSLVYENVKRLPQMFENSVWVGPCKVYCDTADEATVRSDRRVLSKVIRLSYGLTLLYMEKRNGADLLAKKFQFPYYDKAYEHIKLQVSGARGIPVKDVLQSLDPDYDPLNHVQTLILGARYLYKDVDENKALESIRSSHLERGRRIQTGSTPVILHCASLVSGDVAHKALRFENNMWEVTEVPLIKSQIDLFENTPYCCWFGSMLVLNYSPEVFPEGLLEIGLADCLEVTYSRYSSSSELRKFLSSIGYKSLEAAHKVLSADKQDYTDMLRAVLMNSRELLPMTF